MEDKSRLLYVRPPRLTWFTWRNLNNKAESSPLHDLRWCLQVNVTH